VEEHPQSTLATSAANARPGAPRSMIHRTILLAMAATSGTLGDEDHAVHRTAIAIAFATIVGCQNTIELPMSVEQQAGSDAGGPTSRDGGETLAPDGDSVDDSASDEDTYDPGDEYLPPPDCGTLDGESDDADLSNGGVLTGTRFCELYRDVFHHEGSAKCQTLHCHGGGAGQHDLSMGWTKDECYRAMTTFQAKYFTPEEQLVTPRAHGDSMPVSAIARYLHPDGGDPFMPQVKSYLGNRKLDDATWQRVKGWLERGAPND
jgi:hypothetical protein